MIGTIFTNVGWPGLDEFEPSLPRSRFAAEGDREELPPTARLAHPFGAQLFSEHPEEFRSRLFYGRLLVSVFAVAGTVALFYWGGRLFGPDAGLAAALLWAYQPQVLSHGSLITNDIPAATMMFLTSMMFCTWIRSGRWDHAVLGGFLLGACTLCKFTGFLLWPIFLGFTTYFLVRSFSRTRLFQAVLAVVVAIFVIGIPFGFKGVGKPIGQLSFLTDPIDVDPRYSSRWFASVPAPFPEDFILGIDRQQFDFDTGMISYVAGEVSDRGWWWFYLYSMAVKLPTGTLVVAVASLAFGFLLLINRKCSSFLKFEPLLIGSVAFSMIEVTAYKSGFAQQHRYIFPLYPFLFLLLVAPLSLPSVGIARVFKLMIKVGIGATVLASIWIAPHWLGSFNRLSGGVERSHWHLFNDATDWGQDCYYLADWIRSHPDHRPLKWMPLISLRGIRHDAFGIPLGIEGPMDPNRKWVMVSKSELTVNPNLRASLPKNPAQVVGTSHLLYEVNP